MSYISKTPNNRPAVAKLSSFNNASAAVPRHSAMRLDSQYGLSRGIKASGRPMDKGRRRSVGRVKVECAISAVISHCAWR